MSLSTVKKKKIRAIFRAVVAVTFVVVAASFIFGAVIANDIVIVFAIVVVTIIGIIFKSNIQVGTVKFRAIFRAVVAIFESLLLLVLILLISLWLLLKVFFLLQLF